MDVCHFKKSELEQKLPKYRAVLAAWRRATYRAADIDPFPWREIAAPTERVAMRTPANPCLGLFPLQKATLKSQTNPTTLNLVWLDALSRFAASPPPLPRGFWLLSSEKRLRCLRTKASSRWRSVVHLAESPCKVEPLLSRRDTVTISRPLKSGALGCAEKPDRSGARCGRCILPTTADDHATDRKTPCAPAPRRVLDDCAQCILPRAHHCF